LMPDPIIDRWQTLAGIDSALVEGRRGKNRRKKNAGNNPTSTTTPAAGSAEKPAAGSAEKPDENLEKKKKEFEKPLKDIRGKVKEDDVSDEDIFKVFDAIISAGEDGKGPEIK
jgi:hypothetical protein